MASRFRLGRVLGTGAMGTVHEAIDVTLDRPVALKVLRASLAKDPHQLARFEREARAVARLAHPNVVGVSELVRDDEHGLVLVMELLKGASLDARLVDGPLGEAEAVSVFMQALDGLAAAHAAGMVHRDLKPSNIFLVPIASGVLVKVLDFGIVKLAEDGALPKLTRKGALIGTPAYMSPEQVACSPVDARSDVYSMGACLYEALVGRPPYDGAHPMQVVAAVVAGPPPDLREIDRDVSPDLAHIARVAMSRDPSGRYQSADAMREALRSAVTDRPAPREPREDPAGWSAPREGSPPSHAGTLGALPLESRWRGAAVLALALAAAVVIGWLASREPDAPVSPADPSAPSPAPPPPLALPQTEMIAPIPDEVPRGVDPPERVVAPELLDPPSPPRRPRPPGPRASSPPPPASTSTAPSEPPPSTRRLGEDVLDPFSR